MQPTHRITERRTKSDAEGAFTFWFRRPYADSHAGAWMLSRSAEQASFITSTSQAPGVGEKLELTEPCAADAATCGSGAGLPRTGRVIRLDQAAGGTQRVAIRFD